MWFLLVIGAVPCLPLLWGYWRVLRIRRTASEGFGGLLLRGLGWQALCVIPAAVGQMIWAAAGRPSFSPGIAVLGAPLSLWVLLGGATVQSVFEDTAKEISGHRQMTMIDNWPWYLTLTAVQAGLLSLIVAFRLRRSGRKLADPGVVAVGTFALVNAACGVTWPWWGS